MTDHLWVDDVAHQLEAALADAFPGVPFAVAPLVGARVAGIDVAWTDGPPLHQVDQTAQGFVLDQGLAAWPGPLASGASAAGLDRITKRRAMSAATENLLRQVLISKLGVTDLDPEQLYPLQVFGTHGNSRHQEGTASELLDQLFESSSFVSRVPALGGTEPAGFLCLCPACPLG